MVAKLDPKPRRKRQKPVHCMKSRVLRRHSCQSSQNSYVSVLDERTEQSEYLVNRKGTDPAIRKAY